MAEGWVSGADARLAGLANGCKGFGYREGDLYLEDVFYKHPETGMSAGTTKIFQGDTCVWVMNYYGFYQKVAIPFLKKLLLATYEQREFCGGRGPAFFKEGDLEYANEIWAGYVDEIRMPGFRRFCGRERIVRANTHFLGYHDYMGGSLLSQD